MLFAVLHAVSVGAEEWLPMPDGRYYHHTCVHRAGESLPQPLPPCPHAPRQNHRVENKSLGSENPSLGSVEDRGDAARLGYYSDWAVYAQIALKGGFSGMSSSFAVPPAPTSQGPAGLSSVYLFNGLEDGGGHHGGASFILQPVLQYGKSGCVLDPLKWHSWHFIAFVVDGAGRAHCGETLQVDEGETLVGNMSLRATSDTQQTWEVLALRPATGERSSKVVALDRSKVVDAAYVTVEVMICYSCGAYPDAAEVTFSSNVLLDGAGKRVPIGDAAAAAQWTPMARHTECGQRAVPASDGCGDVALRFRNESGPAAGEEIGYTHEI